MAKTPILQVSGLSTYFETPDGRVQAVDDVSYELFPGETLGIVGESGCGKSITALAVMRLLSSPPASVNAREVRFMGQNLMDLSEREMRAIRGHKLAMIFQDPMTSLNPVMSVGAQICEPLILHLSLSKAQAKAKAIDILRRVQIPEPERRFNEYPHQLSGGMRQRVMIAIAIACDPQVLIADEPTTALDVTIQAQILMLLAQLGSRLGMGMVLITHDLGVVSEMCDRVVVMYAGRKVEESTAAQLFENPLHPYTKGLLNSMPKLNEGESTRLQDIPGTVPSLLEMPAGCRFAPRCSLAMEKCRTAAPPLERMDNGQVVACFAVTQHA